jgi:hypothetical protein
VKKKVEGEPTLWLKMKRLGLVPGVDNS